MVRTIWIAAAVAGAGLVVALCLASRRRSSETPGGPVAVEQAPAPQPGQRRVLPVPLFKQWDPAWGDDNLGGTQERLRYAGCTVCCVAMTFTHLGVPTTPRQLNDWLRANGGFTPRGLLVWAKAVEFTGGRLRLEYAGEGDGAGPRIDGALSAGRPVIVKVMLEGGIPHWVLVVGTEGGEYLVNDPLGLEREPVRLSAFGGRVHAVRIFGRR